LIASEEFKGKTAEAFKMQMQHHKSVINAILYEMGKGIEYCETLENKVGFVDLIEDEIIEQIEALRARNRQIEDDMEELKRYIEHRWITETYGSFKYSQYYIEITNNKHMIEILNQKLEKIDDIEASVKSLFSTDGIDSIKSAIRALHEGFSETDFVPITYPSICAITKLKSLEDETPDPRGIRTGIDESFITVLNDDGTEKKGKNNIELGFGGYQGWIDSEISGSACGVVAAVNTYLYITGQTTITESEYVDLCMQFCDEHPLDNYLMEKEIFGAIPPSMGDYIEDRGDEHGLSIKTSWNWYKGSDQYDTMKKMLANNIPVIWGLYSVRGKVLTLYTFEAGTYVKKYNDDEVNNHYVVATAIYEQEQADGSYRRMVEVSSWGKRYYIDYDEFLDFVMTLYQENPEYRALVNHLKESDIDGEAFVNSIGSNILEIKID
ncbi:MAG: hypothetical protein K2H07_02720, partial [Lachnospiraceae bacterium]|nr:hypothetical protein [Lachnospiraceae bacterium]